MTPDEQHDTIIERMTGWMQQLRDLHATPLILIGVRHPDGALQAYIPMDTPEDRALMAQVLRQVLADFEAVAPGGTA